MSDRNNGLKPFICELHHQQFGYRRCRPRRDSFHENLKGLECSSVSLSCFEPRQDAGTLTHRCCWEGLVPSRDRASPDRPRRRWCPIWSRTGL
jgi:hypothetical protein